MNTELGDRMRKLAETRDDLPEDWLEKAEAFDRASEGYLAEVQTVNVKTFMGCFARARRMWCNATGEPLV